MIQLVEGDLERFFQAPFHAYGPDAPYVSPLRSDLERFLSTRKNPLFQSADDLRFFTALRDGQPVGRITAHVHRASNLRHGLNTAYFGYFDCINDTEIANTLLAAAEAWAKSKGFDRLVGNFNLTAMQQAGVMTSGFDAAPYTDQIWGAPWLPRLLEAAEYRREFPMTTHEIDLTAIDLDRLSPPSQRDALRAEGYQLMPVTRRTLAARLEDSREILNRSFIDNPMFVPLTEREYSFQAEEMKWVMDPRISSVVHKEGKPVGAIIAIPDLNPLVKRIGARIGITTPWHWLRYRFSRRRAVIIFQGVMPDHQSKGLNPAMLAHALGAMRKAGYRTAGGTWIADVNRASLRQAEKIGAKTLHGLHLFGKDLV